MKKGLNIEVTSGQYDFLYDLIMMAYELNIPEQKGWDMQTYDNLVDNVCQAKETYLSNTVIQRILEIENFQNVACVCDNWAEFTQELEEWGVYGCAKIDFDDPDLDFAKLDRFIKAEYGYIKDVA